MSEDNVEITSEEDDLFEHYRIVIDKGQSAIRLDKYLSIHVAKASRTKIQNGIEAEAVRVNGQAKKASYKVKPYDIITLSLPEPPRDTEIIPEDIPLNILYEDDALLIVNKPTGMVVHPAFGHWSGTLIHALAFHFKQLPTGTNGDIRPGLVHRIDKDTSGLLVIAKTEFAMSFLAKQFSDHSIERTYNAIIWGEPKNDKGMVTGHIGRNLKDRKVMDIFPDGSHGRHAVTHYEVLKRLREVSLIQCKLETGRTHQIRVHMKYIGHPIFNDTTYGGNKILRGASSGSYKAMVENCFSLLPSQALHAKSLGFVHPTTKEWMQFDTELPENFKAILDKWENYVNHP
ncbi:RluA family pseudouridine synthase [Dyadobacter sediminis]|uniref:Pseudouridine synthase n=1 Tax=Dyadobacter sediminis TaxID=1493691 RepID=A0A5R9KEQ4_9BACT|nr:RluA family pseudouridine synthase [Dyadobacter sediminis]TLU94640.1 RluA family pseudouridine synthase [Dyadobacter sediminis]GGB89493.1 pseudouridine synthase [Dyadobacter sediminis]